jgi:hypothetical protein
MEINCMKAQSLVIAIVLACVACIGNATAQETIDKTQRVDQIVEKQARIRADVQASRNGWETLSQEKRDEVLKQQDQALGMLQGKQTIGDLMPDQQVEVVNLLSAIETTATGAEDERIVCVRERKVGSNMPKRVCRTVGQMRREREATQNEVQNANSRQGGM